MVASPINQLTEQQEALLLVHQRYEFAQIAQEKHDDRLITAFQEMHKTLGVSVEVEHWPFLGKWFRELRTWRDIVPFRLQTDEYNVWGQGDELISAGYKVSMPFRLSYEQEISVTLQVTPIGDIQYGFSGHIFQSRDDEAGEEAMLPYSVFNGLLRAMKDANKLGRANLLGRHSHHIWYQR